MRYAFDGGWCSSVVVSNTTLLTAKHCTDAAGDEPGFVFNVDGTVDAVKPLATSLEVDVAVLVAAERLPDSFIVPVADTRAQIDSEGWVAGYGCSHGRHVDVRSLTKRAEVDGLFGNERFEMWRGAVCPGDSGSPLFNRAGELLGITSRQGLAGPFNGTGLFVPLAEAR